MEKHQGLSTVYGTSDWLEIIQLFIKYLCFIEGNKRKMWNSIE